VENTTKKGCNARKTNNKQTLIDCMIHNFVSVRKCRSKVISLKMPISHRITVKSNNLLHMSSEHNSGGRVILHPSVTQDSDITVGNRQCWKTHHSSTFCSKCILASQMVTFLKFIHNPQPLKARSRPPYTPYILYIV
jgi:hypothetical protein